MDKTYVLAEQLMKILPHLGRNITVYLRESGEEETTLMQVSVLHQIQNCSISASELAKSRRVSLQSASVLVSGLVERGWIDRIPDPNDRRRFLLQITPEGLEKAAATRNQIIRFLAVYLEDLSEEEVVAAEIFLPAISRILTQHMTPDTAENEKQHSLKEE